jgi:hypothetical protein
LFGTMSKITMHAMIVAMSRTALPTSLHAGSKHGSPIHREDHRFRRGSTALRFKRITIE